MKVMTVVGARPNFMKAMPLVAELRRRGVAHVLVHTGQHYDRRMSDLFFEELGLPEPDYTLGVGSGSHAVVTAGVMTAIEPVLEEEHPDVVVVVGDVNSTLAAAVVSSKLGVRLAHVEAGLRSFDRTMPEEINRILTDAVADVLLVTEPSGVENLRREGIAEQKIHLVGNVMVDTLFQLRGRARELDVPSTMGLEPEGYGLVTLHRPANVDAPEALGEVVKLLEGASARLPLIFPVHPRTRGRLESAGLVARLDAGARLRLVEPLGYLEFLGLMERARVVLTDSGGIQEETTMLGVPCLTVRENTERPVTLSEGTNRLVGTRAAPALASLDEVLAEPARGTGRAPALWDGRAATRIADVLVGVGAVGSGAGD